jgi:hypothetical protein
MIGSLETEIIESFPYRQLIGKLIYLASATRPDISYAVGVLCRVLDRPTNVHINGAKRVLRYLKGTRDYGLILGRYPQSGNKLSLIGFSDSSFNDDKKGKATTGIATFLGRSLISWKSKKQDTITTSTQESEYVALCLCTQE